MRHLIILTAFALSGYFNLNVTSDIPDAVININYSTVAVADTEVLNPLYTLPTKTRFNPNCNIEQGIAILPKTGVCFIEDVVFESYNALQEDFYKNDVILQMASLQSQYKAGTFIDIDQTTYTPEQLITDILVNNPCATISNVISSTGSDFGTGFGFDNGIAYFSADPGAFPFESGIVLSTGDAALLPGPKNFSGDESSGNVNWEGDGELEAVIPGMDPMESVNATSIQFDFIPTRNTISFDFLFASEEYGEFQCNFGDAFAFILTDLDNLSVNPVNLAVVPGTTDVVSVLTVRDQAYEAGCLSVNPQYFGAFYDVPSSGSNPIQLRGHTLSMTAFSPVTPGTNYRIKLVIADYFDNTFNSAVFLKQNSFNAAGGSLGDDITIANGTAQCEGTTVTLTSSLPTAGHIWYFNGAEIIGETGATLDVTVDGTYSADITISPTCTSTDEVLVEFIPAPTADVKTNEQSCTSYTLEALSTNNNYYTATGGPNGTGTIVTAGTDIIVTTTLYVYTETGIAPNICSDETSFIITIDGTVVADTPMDLEACDTYTLPALTANNTYHTATGGASTTELPVGEIITSTTTLFVYKSIGTAPNICTDESSFLITIEDSPTLTLTNTTCSTDLLTYNVSFTVSSTSALITTTAGTVGSGNITDIPAGTDITITATNPSNSSCTADLDVTAPNCSCPIIDAPITPNNPSVCAGVTTPTLTVTLPGLPSVGDQVNWYDASSGGTLLQSNSLSYLPTGPFTAGTTYTYYAEAEESISGCVSSRIAVTLTWSDTVVADSPMDVEACDTYTLPPLTANNTYHTVTGGSPTTEVSAGTDITTTTTLFVYKSIGTAPNNCTDEDSFVVTINTSPTADVISDVQSCGAYTLPTLSANNDYYSATGGPNGTGTLIASGTDISGTSTLYVYTEIGTAPNICSDETSFTVTIDAAPVADSPMDVEVCDTYNLPALTADNTYHTATGGASGTEVSAGTDITTTTTLYVYKSIGTAPNICTDESSFVVTINASPTADVISDVQSCGPYTLPTLSANNDYYSATGGPNGTGTLIASGTDITVTTTLYVYTETGTAPNICSDETSFTVTIDAAPVADSPMDVEACDTYTLPALTANNTYHTISGGSPTTEVSAGTDITTTTTLFVYKSIGTAPNICTDENSFVVTINTSPTADVISDVQSCGAYTLPTLSANNNYYSATGGPNGTGTLIASGTDISATSTLYVYTETGTAPNICSDETSFTVTIDAAPVADSPMDVEVCDTYNLPALTADNTYHTATGGASTTELPVGEIITSTTTLFVYKSIGTAPNNCTDEDSFVVTINTSPTADVISDVQSCGPFTLPTLSANNDYYSATGGPNGTGTLIASGTDITATSTLYVYTETGITPNICSDETSFTVTIDVAPVADSPMDVEACDTYTLPALTANNTYHTATGGASATEVSAGTDITTTTTLFVYKSIGTAPNICTDESSFVVTINASPTADVIADEQSCSSYILPVLSTNNDYYSATGGPNGTGTIVTAGTDITATSTLYIYTETGTAPNICFDETSFTVTIDAAPVADSPMDVEACDTYTLPALTANNTYHTATGGASGTEVSAGTDITSTTTLFVYKSIGTAPNNCTDESSFVITINTSPTADVISDVQSCGAYTLPTLSANNDCYSTTGGPNGTGTLIASGTDITATTTLYVYTEIGTAPNICSDETSFTVTIDAAPVADSPMDVEACDTYTLPALTANNTYHTATGGASGTEVSAGTDITSTTTLFVYKSIGTAPNICTDESSFVVTINTSPTADVISDVQSCGAYTLPTLSANNNYYSATGGPNGTGTIVTAGTDITGTSTLYVYTETGTAPNICSDESSFTVTIDAAPVADSPMDVEACDTYTLPALTANNTYHTATGGASGTEVSAGTDITTTTTLYVYKSIGTAPNNCTDESSFVITINASPTADVISDEQSCSSYTLPTLSANNDYYSATGGPNGTGTLIASGTDITATSTLYIYTETGTAPNICSDETSFTVTIDAALVADSPMDVEACDTYTLPALTANNTYHTATGGASGTEVSAGTDITSTTTLFVYKSIGTAPNNCTDESSFVITINTSPTADVISDVQSCGAYTLPTLSANNDYYSATGGPNGTGTIVTAGTDITGTSTLYVYTETGTAPNICSDETSFTVTIDAAPVADSPMDVEACDTYTLQALTANNTYHTATGGSPTTEVSAGTAITSTTTLYVYKSIGTAPNICTDESSFDITINTSPTADVIADEQSCSSYILPVLSTNNDYYSATGGPNGTGTLIASGTDITATTTLYVYTEIGTAPNICSDETSFTVTIDAAPVADSPMDVEACDTYTLPALTANNTYHTATGGASGTEVSAGTDITSTTTLFVYKSIGTAPNICTDESSFVVTINASPILTLINTSCSTDLLTYSVSFSVSSNSAVITSSAGTVGSGNITDIPVGTDITITASNSVNTFCDTVLNVTAPNCACIFVDEPISPNNPIVCEGSSTPNLTVAIPGLPAVGNQINWYDTPVGGSLLQSNSLTYLPTGTFIPGTTYTYYAEAEESVTGCVSSRIAVTLTWVTSIVAETAVDVSICGSYILPALSQNNTYYTASGGPNGTGVAISDFTEITASSTLFIYAEAGTSPNTCTDESSFNIIIQDGAQANLDMVPIVYQLCDDALDGDGNTTNDSVQFDLITQNTDILDGQSVANFSVTYYLNQTDANAGLNPLPLIYENISNPQIIYVRVDNDTMADDGSGTGAMVDTSLCYDIATLTLQVNPLADFELDATYLLCVNTNGTEVISSPIIDTGLNTTDYTFEWLLENVTIPGASGNTLEPLVGGNYSVIVTDIRTSTVTVCEASATTVVIESAPPAVAVEVLTEAFSDEQNIFVTTVGNGASEYEFSLDNGPWEINVPNNGTYTFTDVGAGDHIVTVRDRNGCGEASASVSIIGYPHVFTPNGDGYNDTWAIYGIGDQPDAVIYIFDRYGKLLKQFSPTSLGWDGTYNGNLMPTNDYWFTIDYMGADNNRKQFKAHFTLKR